MKHTLVETVTVQSEGLVDDVDLKEVECGDKYVVLEIGANYCTRCGEELE